MGSEIVRNGKIERACRAARRSPRPREAGGVDVGQALAPQVAQRQRAAVHPARPLLARPHVALRAQYGPARVFRVAELQAVPAAAARASNLRNQARISDS